MFRITDPQVSLFECQFLLPPDKVARLEKSWAAVFRDRVLPLIDEELFRDAFSEDKGRPNASIQLLVAIHLLKEWDDLTDGQILEFLEFNLQWHYALRVEPAVAHLCQKTLHNFRVMLMQNKRAEEMFVGITNRLAEMDGLALGRQRLDSMHVISNIATLTRLGLFVETVTAFLKELRRALPGKLAEVERGYTKRYLEREGYFADAKKEQARRRLPAVATDVMKLVQAFEHDEDVCALESYQLLARLFEEQCEVVEGDEPEASPVAVVDERRACGEPEAQPEANPGEDTGQAQTSQATIEPSETDAQELPRRCDNESMTGVDATAGNEDGPAQPAAEPSNMTAEQPRETTDEGDKAADTDPATAPDVGPRGGDNEIASGTERSPEDDGGETPRARAEPSEMPADGPEEPTGQRDETAEAEPATVPEGAAPRMRLKEGREIESDSLQSPHDPDATYGRKGKGYEVQVAETCEEDNPYQVITGIEVNGAHESDQNATVPIVKQLSEDGLKPDELFADTGYGSGQNIIDCAKMGVDLLAPVPDPDAPRAPDPWEKPAESIESGGAPEEAAEPASFDSVTGPSQPIELDAFTFNDTFDEVLACPGGHAPHQQHLDAPGRTIWATFSAGDCAECPLASRCPTRPKKTGERTLRSSMAGAATAHRQRTQTTAEFKDRYKIRSGVESTNAELKGRHGARHLQVRRRDRVRLAMKLKAMALNTKRAVQHHTARIRELAQPRLSDLSEGAATV